MAHFSVGHNRFLTLLILQKESYVALNTRIKFVRLLFQILLSFNRRENHSSSMGETQRLLTTCGLLIPSLIKTVDKGVPKVGCKEPLKCYIFSASVKLINIIFFRLVL